MHCAVGRPIAPYRRESPWYPRKKGGCHEATLGDRIYLASASQTSDFSVHAVSSLARREEALEPFPTTTTNAGGG